MSDDPSSIYAGILAKVGFFAHLDRVALARLAGYVEPIPVDDGTMVCREGDRADGIYIVTRGTFGVFATANDLSEIRLETLTAGDFFGEMTVLDDSACTPTIRAEGGGELLKLDRAHVNDLFRIEPSTRRAVATILRRRLNVADLGAEARQRSKTTFVNLPGHADSRGQAEVRERMTRGLLSLELQQLEPDRLRRVLEASILEEVSFAALRVVFKDDAETVARDLSQLGVRGGRASSPTGQILRERFEQEFGRERVEAFALATAEQLADEQRWNDALALLARYGLRSQLVETLGHALSASSHLSSERAAHWVASITDDEAVQHGRVVLARAALHESRGDIDAAVRLLRRGLGAGLAAADPAVGPQLANELTRLAEITTTKHDRGRSAEKRRRPRLGTHLAIGISLALVIAAAVAGSEDLAGRFLLLLIAALVIWISGVLPDFTVGLLLASAWILFSVAKPAQAFAGFASTNWLFVVAVLGIAAAVARSGLLFRVGLLLVRRMPPGLFWQASTLLLTGVVLLPLLPQPQGRVALTGPIALSLAETLKLRDREPAASVLGLAAWIGSSPLQFLFLNGSPLVLFGWGLLPEESRMQFTWIHWILATAPLGAMIAVGALMTLFLVFRPKASSAPSRDRVNLQLAVLGPLSRRELTMVVVLVLTVVGWMASSTLRVDVGTIAVLGLVATVVTGLFDRRALQGLDWNYLIFFGVMLGIRGLMHLLGLDRIIAETVGTATGPIRGQPILIILIVACSSFLVRLFLAQTAALLALGLAVIPIAPALGVHPWILLITLLATSGMWFLPSQSASYLVAYSVTEGRLFSHGQARWIAFAYALVTLAGLILTVPYWRFLGLL